MNPLTKTLLCFIAALPAVYAAPLVQGDTSGNTPGTNAIDIQTARDAGQGWQAATGNTSIAFGTANSASGPRSMSLGQRNESTNDLSMSVGAYNVVDGFGLALGYFNTIDYSSDAYTVDGPSGALGLSNSVSGFSSYGMGNYNSLGSESAAVGSFNNLSSGSRSHALGFSNMLYYAADSVAVGNYNTVNSSGATIIGFNDTIWGTNAVVVGNSNTAYESNTIIIGTGITNGTVGSMMFGPSDAAKVTILSDGKVGIGLGGSGSPTEKLHVSGNIKLTGSLVTSSGTLALPASGTLVATSGSGSTTRLLVGGTTTPSSSWQGTTVIGANGVNKVIAGYLASSTNGAIIGGHNSALNAWADLNIAGSNLIFRTNETERMRLASTGNFGIGTSDPKGKLSVGASTVNPTTGEILVSDNSPQLILEESGVTAENRLWDMLVDTEQFRLRAINDANSSATNFLLVDRTGTTIDTVVFPNGNVGIGSSIPGAKLAVQGNGAPVSNTATPNGLLILSGQGTTNTVLTAGVDNTGGNSHGWLQARHATTGPAYYPIALNPSGGNVGIGTGPTAPAAKLEVNGSTRLVGDVTVKNVGSTVSVIRISAAGDIGMGSFTSGTNPN